MKLDMYNKSTIQGECYRDDEDSVLYKLLDNLEPGIIDGIIGGVPCQGFSLSGNRDKNDPRNSLFMEFVRWS